MNTHSEVFASGIVSNHNFAREAWVYFEASLCSTFLLSLYAFGYASEWAGHMFLFASGNQCCPVPLSLICC